jgi:O-antigen ligase
MLVWVTYPALLPHFSGKHRVAALAAFLVIALAILLSGERTALLLLGFGGLIAALLLPVRRTWLLGGVACLLVLGGAVALLSPVIFERQVASSIHTLTHWSESPYGMLLASDLTLAAEHPVIGLGVGQFKEHCEALYPGDAERITAMCNTHPHNIWMEWLIEEGIIGLILFSCFVFAVLAACLRSSALRTNPAFAGWFISFTLRVWPFMATTGFFSRWGAPPFWLALGCLLVYTAGKGQKNAGSPLAVQAPEL